MNEIVTELCLLVQYGLKNKVYQTKFKDETALYKHIYEHGVAAIAFLAIDKNVVSNAFFEHLQKVFYAFVKRDQQQLDLKNTLEAIFNKAEIDYVFLKGIKLKEIYPETFMRGMGDIDVLIREKDLDNVHKQFKMHEITCMSRSKQHDVFKTKTGLMIEIHPTLYKDFNTKYEVLFSHPFQYATHIKENQYTLSVEYELVYLLYHLAKHLDSSGIGLRSLLDIGLYVKTYEDHIRIETLNDLLNQVDMHRFYQSIMQLNQLYFGFEYKKDLHLKNPLDPNTLDAFTTYMISSGIHGLGEKFNAFEARAASYQMHEKNMFKWIIDLMFPNYETMKGMYPSLLKLKFLLPIAWLKRFFNLIFIKRKSTLKKLKKLRLKKQKVNESEQLFIEIGLK